MVESCKFCMEVLGFGVCAVHMVASSEWCRFWKSCASYKEFSNIDDKKVDEIRNFLRETDEKWDRVRFTKKAPSLFDKDSNDGLG